MAELWTTLGLIDEARLERRDGVVDNDNEHTTWQEYRYEGELVKREAQVRLKQPIVAIADIGTPG